jgi:hypothetical protein
MGGNGLIAGTSSSVSDGSGLASNQLVAGPFTASVNAVASACLAGTTNCATFTVTPVHAETAALAAWSGTSQSISAEQRFAPVVLRVTDQFGHSLAGANVVIAEMLAGWTEPCAAQGACPAAPIFGQQIVQTISDVNGLVSLTPLSGHGVAARLLVMAATGNATLTFELDQHP